MTSSTPAWAGRRCRGSPGANLLQMDFLASSNASGVFGIFAEAGSGEHESGPIAVAPPNS